MLSGGERALTAVALLFAMLEVHPVPFCVLDEVDAALDEANVGRFVEALRGLADQTQFIVITHNRGTIETADALYGVTVGDDAISHVISLRLEEAREVADQVTARRPRRPADRRFPLFFRRKPKDEPSPAGAGRAGGSRRPRRPRTVPDAAAPAAPRSAPTDRIRRRDPRRPGGRSREAAAAASCRACAASCAAGPSDADWEEVEEMLIAGDVGGALAAEVVEKARARRDAPVAEAAVRAELAAPPHAGRARLAPRAAGEPGQPAVVLMVGVNGTGKTTTIGKLAHLYRAEGSSVLLAAADTFRAAAIDQLRIWADRSGCQFVAHAPGADPAAVIYDALDAAVARNVDVVIADTAGRLHTKSSLMDELAKMRRVIDKPTAGLAARRSCSCWTPRPARTGWPRRRSSTRRSASPASS